VPLADSRSAKGAHLGLASERGGAEARGSSGPGYQPNQAGFEVALTGGSASMQGFVAPQPARNSAISPRGRPAHRDPGSWTPNCTPRPALVWTHHGAPLEYPVMQATTLGRDRPSWTVDESAREDYGNSRREERLL